jgi:hypothetical protein
MVRVLVAQQCIDQGPQPGRDREVVPLNRGVPPPPESERGMSARMFTVSAKIECARKAQCEGWWRRKGTITLRYVVAATCPEQACEAIYKHLPHAREITVGTTLPMPFHYLGEDLRDW